MLTSFYNILIMAMAVTSCSYTISKAKVFENIRNWIYDRNEWLGKLITCPYCTSHWLIFALAINYKTRLISGGWLPVDYAVTIFAIVTLANLMTYILITLMGLSKALTEE